MTPWEQTRCLSGQSRASEVENTIRGESKLVERPTVVGRKKAGEAKLCPLFPMTEA